MRITDYLMIAATMLGPILAIQVQKWLERWREDNSRKVAIFKALMTTRATRLSPLHVEALNQIDVEFRGRKYKKVLEAWKAYHDHLGQKPQEETRAALWGEKMDELLIDLLYEMGNSLKYHFDKTHIKRAAYFPQGHGEI